MLTNDKIIRRALHVLLDKELAKYRQRGYRAEIIEELGVHHGTARIDIALINGTMHGYEIKSDRDTLDRLPEQMEEFNTVFDKLTLVVGRRHLYQAMHIVPDWWGVVVAKFDSNNRLVFQTIRKPDNNREQVGVSIAGLLWRKEALQILKEQNEADGLLSKPRKIIYARLADILDIETLKKTVSTFLVSREHWRPGVQLTSGGG
ncbi:MAG: sce7726 family protein [Candidatus Hydrothermia bacterium]|nr:sce7726 family protein [Candidatus Hydrothermia bacterium]